MLGVAGCIFSNSRFYENDRFNICRSRRVGLALRRVLAGGAKSSGGNQVSRIERRPFVGAVVLELSGGIKERWLVENGEGQPAGEILFCVSLERWRGWARHSQEI